MSKERIFSKEFMYDVLDEEEGVKHIKDEIIEHTRWSVIHSLIFEYEGKFYETTYDAPATEYQDGQGPFDWAADEVVCTEVEKVEAMVYKWKPVP